MEHPLRKVLALADAELSPAEVPGLVQEMARNPSLVRALQSYLAVGRRRIAAPYAAKAHEPVPQWLVDTVMHAPIQGPEAKSFNVVSFGRGFLERLKGKYRMPGWSLAAGPAVAAILAAVSVLQLVPRASEGERMLAAQLQQAIDRTRSGQEAPLLTFRPVLTFLDKDQTYCRQYEVRGGGERSFAVACRSQSGNWDITMQTAPSPTGTAPAGSVREELDRFVGSRMGRALDKDETDRAVSSQWSALDKSDAPTPR
jgi:hypothetical protein